ncbi:MULTISPECIES: response regulator transcription factor [Sphingomonadaceae]|uniref:DNA-binding response regulator n=1 Tax=Sphingomonas bisphenolicum TaxID=296544 RepID=A0ABM7FSR4_9SPHN|nr:MULTISPECIES: response regulator transcription factor [Sphingomonadaceae]MBA4091604.1 DNA-binding response regulator [Sphingobium sp.]MBZ9647478.1 response regulator transcription factor [Sphingobium sp. 3R8]BBF68038.1 DNA-binding response regulator [Sphingomonas bisphenolicum]
MVETVTGGRVLIADDHPLIREGLALAARAVMPGVTVDTAGTIGETLATLKRHAKYRLILLDFVLPDARGFSGFLQVQHEAGRTPIAMISAHENATLVESARALGAAGFLYKTRPFDDLARDIKKLAEGQTSFPAVDIDANPADLRDRIATLSGAQLRVLIALSDGRLNKQIAADLAVSEATVKAHLTAIFRKLDVGNRAQALLAVQPLLGDVAAARPT